MNNFDIDDLGHNSIVIPPEEVAVIDDEISFGLGEKAIETEEVSVLDVAAPVVALSAAPIAAAIVREREVIEPVEETVPAPVSVISEPDVAPIVEPVHRVRWPWALLALPLLAIPFIHRSTETPVADPVVVQAPLVRELVVTPEPTTRVIEVIEPATPKCNGEFVTKGATTLLETPAESAKAIQAVATDTVVYVESATTDGYYKVKVDTVDGYLPISIVACQVAQARTVVTG